MDGTADRLAKWLTVKQRVLVERWTAAVETALLAGELGRAELVDHIPVFVTELRDLLAAAGEQPVRAAGRRVRASAERHGAQRLRQGFNVGDVVREYGLLHECLLEMLGESDLAIGPSEQLLLAHWFNAGIANAVTQYVADRDRELEAHVTEHVGFLAHELRNPLASARLALHELREAEIAPAVRRPVELIDRVLRRGGELIDRTLAHAALELGGELDAQPLAVCQLLDEIIREAELQARAKGITLSSDIGEVPPIRGDARLLRSAIENLLHNALKFTPRGGDVGVRAYHASSRIIIEISDSCGGLPPGQVEDLFRPRVQRSEDRSGFGLGLAIARQAVVAHGGTIEARDRPGRGCVFVVSLPGY